MKELNIQRVLAFLMAFCMLASVLAACTPQDNNESKPSEPTGTTGTAPITSPTTEPTEPAPTETEPTEPEPTETEPTEPEPTEPEPTETEPTEPEPPVTEPPATTPPVTEPPVNVPSDDVLNIVMPEPGADGTFQADTQYIFGVGYVEDQMNNRVSVDQVVYIVRAMGVRSVRVWSGADDYPMDDWKLDRLHDLIAKLHDADIQVIMFYSRFVTPGGDGGSFPYPDYTEGSDYLSCLENWYERSKYLAEEFPEVEYWEVGNEWNHNPFLHPIGWKEDGTGTPSFTMEEKAQISVDLMYMATKGIRDGGSDGLIIAPSMAPSDGMDGVDMSDWLEYVYQMIENGESVSGSTNKRDYFEALSWHPYIGSVEPDMEWVENNHRLYQIAVDHGDAGIKVFLTEYGMYDGGNNRADATQAEWMVKAYELVRRYMPYVESLHYYRLFTDTSRAADLYGLMHQPEDGFGPKAKGLAYQEMAGGQGDLYKFYMPLYSEGEEPEED